MMHDLERLLAPLNGPHGCGEDLGFSHEFDQIREMRREDDGSLAQGEWIANLKTADWPGVASLCGDLLAARSKDLRLANWYVEAQAKLQGFAGLSHGSAVLAALLERYWDGLYPEVDDGDLELRIGTLSWFVTRSTELLRQIPLTNSPKGRFSLVDHEAARAFESAAEKDPDLRDNLPPGKPTLALVAEAQRSSGREFYAKLLEQIAAARAAWKQLAQGIDSRLGMDGPSFRDVFGAFDDVENLVQRIAREQGVLAGGSVPANSTGAAAEPETTFASSGTVSMGPIRDRQQALDLLRQVAGFFERTEPHSPVTYLARKAATWGDMPLHEWLSTVIKDNNALSHINEMLGVGEERS